MNNYLEAESVCREHNILGSLSRIYQVISYTYLAMENNEKFKEYYAKTLEYFDEIKDLSSKTEILNNLRPSTELIQLYLGIPEKVNELKEIWNLINKQIIRGINLILSSEESSLKENLANSI